VNRWIARIAVLFATCVFGAGIAGAQTRTVTLQWTAPGDDGFMGTAKTYDIRFSRSAITSANFLSATKLNTTILPGAAGSKENLTVVGLTAGVAYYFAMRAADVVGNWSPVSNIAYLSSGVAGIDGEMSGPIEFSSPQPNPVYRGSTRFAVTLPQAAWARIEAFDIEGRRVKTLAMGQYSAGHFDVRWDLTDDEGRDLSTGTYLVRGQLGDAVFLRRVTVVH